MTTTYAAFFFYFSGVNSCPPGGHCSTPMKSWEDRNQRFCQVAQSFSWPLILRRGDDSNVVVINITICRIKHRVFPWEKYLVKSHPETSDFLHFYKDMCQSKECWLLLSSRITHMFFPCGSGFFPWGQGLPLGTGLFPYYFYYIVISRGKIKQPWKKKASKCMSK